MHGHVSEAFSSMHNQLTSLQTIINQQKEWLKYLHQNHLSLNSQHADSKEITKAELTKVNSWITYLHKSQEKQEKQMLALQKSIEQSSQGYEKHMSQLYEEVQKVHKKAAEKPAQQVQVIHKEADYDKILQYVTQHLNMDVQAMQTSVKQEVHDALAESLTESLATQLQEQQNTHHAAIQEMIDQLKEQQQAQQEEAGEVQQPQQLSPSQTIAPQSQMQQSQQQYVSQEAVPSWVSQITNPEQKLLNLLMNEADPMTYTKVSQLTGHSINTIRVNMNSLKKKGFVEESTLPSGVKLFSVTNKEKVKKMYNVQVL